jgi:hypothetical protein
MDFSIKFEVVYNVLRAVVDEENELEWEQRREKEKGKGKGKEKERRNLKA